MIQAQRVFRSLLIEVERAQEPAPSSERLQRFKDNYPGDLAEEPIVASHGEYLDDALLQQIGWPVLFQGTSPAVIKKLLAKPENDDGSAEEAKAWIEGAWQIVDTLDPGVLSFVQDPFDVQVHATFKRPLSESARRRYTSNLVRLIQFAVNVRRTGFMEAALGMEGESVRDMMKSILLRQRGHGERHDFEMVNLFVASCMLNDDASFKPARSITSLIASLSHFTRLTALVEANAAFDGRMDVAIRQYRIYLDPKRSTPFGLLTRMMSLLSYGAYREGSMPEWTWKSSTVLVSGMTEVSAEALKATCARILADARRELDTELLFGMNIMRPQLGDVPDEWSNHSTGFGVFHPRDDLLAHVANRGVLIGPDGQPMRDDILRWEEAITTFLHLIFAAVQLTAGQPARVTEIATAMYANSSTNLRSMFLYQGQILLVISHNKTLRMSGQLRKRIPRLLPLELSKLLNEYLILVRPLQIRFARILNPDSDMDALMSVLFMFQGRTAIARPDPVRLRFKATTRSPSVPLGISVADWRHISKAFMRKHVGIVEDEDESDDAMDLQAGHSTKTSLSTYGVTSSDLRSLSSDTIDAFADVSRSWHIFLGLAPKEPPRRKRARVGEALEEALEVQAAVPVRRSIDMLPRPSASTLACLRAVYGQQAYFRSREQLFALEMMREGRNDGIIVLPTGGGKSGLMLCCAKELQGTTILFSPLVALKQDLKRRALEAGLGRRLEIHSIEAAGGLLDSLAQRGSEIKRIIFDEAHLVMSHRGFRSFEGIKMLKALNVPTYLLTATLPPGDEKELAEMFLIASHHVVRAVSTNRPCVQYSVQMEAEIVNRVQEMRWEMTSRDRMLVYVQTIWESEALAQELGTACFHGRLERKAEVMDEWNAGRIDIMVS